MKTKGIGLTVNKPETETKDKNCPFYGKISLRGRLLTGKVIKKNLHKTATIEWERRHYVPKYERYEKRRSRIAVHVPDSIHVNIGDVVTVMETKPISKTKNFVIIEVKQ